MLLVRRYPHKTLERHAKGDHPGQDKGNDEQRNHGAGPIECDHPQERVDRNRHYERRAQYGHFFTSPKRRSRR